MFTGLYAKLAGLAVLVVIFVASGFWQHHQGVVSGRAEVQAQWDTAKSQQAATVAKVEAAATRRVMDLQNQFDALSARYEAATHANPPSVADSVAAGVADGSVRLRDEPVCPGGGQVSAATDRSRAADAAATQALADRVQASIAAVRAGDEADARERLLGAQVTALQAVLKAERSDTEGRPSPFVSNSQ